jgi:glycosyltransferase involved in cell wall biosynthesis
MNSPKYKIVYCTPALYSAGGTERVVSAKANYFAEHFGYDVTIIVTEGNRRNSFFSLSDRVNVINLNLGFEDLWNRPFLKKVYMYLAKQRKYKRLLTRELLRIHPDFTITTLRREINFINEIKDGSRKIGELHLSRANYRGIEDNDSNFIISFFAKYWKRSAVSNLQRLDRCVVLNENALLEWPELRNRRMIPDPLPLNLTAKSSLQLKRIVTIGRYSYEKGYDYLLKIWAVVEKRHPDWQLNIYGMGDPTPYVKLMDELSINPHRCILNSSLVDVESEYLRSSILVHPSRTEGFGLVLIEAMACGLPVVAFDCENGPRSIISDGEDGFLIPTYDIGLFVYRLDLLMDDEALRKKMGERGMVKSQQYQISKIAEQWKQLFDELVQNS